MSHLTFPSARAARSRRVRLVALLAVLDPGLVSGFADNDAGGITTYSLASIQFGYELLWVILVSGIALFITQELGARLGLATGKGMTALIRERFGVRWVAPSSSLRCSPRTSARRSPSSRASAPRSTSSASRSP